MTGGQTVILFWTSGRFGNTASCRATSPDAVVKRWEAITRPVRLFTQPLLGLRLRDGLATIHPVWKATFVYTFIVLGWLGGLVRGHGI